MTAPMTKTFIRTVLAVPAAAERFLAKAQDITASALMVDLEDGVAEPEKAAARVLARQWAPKLAAPTRQLWLRVNAHPSPHLAADLAAIHGIRLDALVLPKATPEAVAALADRTDLPIVALIEGPDGVEDARRTAAHPNVTALMFGELDYRAELARAGGLHADDTSWAQARIVNAAASTAKPAVAGPTTAIDDEQRLRSECDLQAARGFTGKLCIHPRQLDAVHRAFGPSLRMMAWARRVVDAAHDGPGAITVDGAMVDKPVIDRAHHILAEIQQ
ncbi:HpcH/HpaI aldolase/citrate lyase family protein [Streptomyces hokutonensis]|uniref:HpcH/HpaI aldolase/citrate lyase family protein n=1 Tax=Streptomyces hokutonensis TaxID=1306990 RepID=UPI0033D166A4